MDGSQTQTILKHIKTHKKGITTKEAFERYGITRLSAHIFILKDKYKIGREWCEGVTRNGRACRFVRYTYEGKYTDEK